jgi:hypothetical protein
VITHFTFDPVLTDEFIRFGYDLYRGDTNWIPPLRKDLASQLSPGYPFHQKPGNRHRHFLARRGDEVVGRISAMVNTGLKDRDGAPVVTVGFFECREDGAVARDLFDAAIEWLRQEAGATKIWGPMNFDIWHAYRLMIRGFDEKTFYGEPTTSLTTPSFSCRTGSRRNTSGTPWTSRGVRPSASWPPVTKSDTGSCSAGDTDSLHLTKSGSGTKWTNCTAF